MSILRPIGHIAANLQILAVAIAYRMRLASDGQHTTCWADDDGCVYLALVTHPRAAAIRRHAGEQRINDYRKPKGKPWPLTSADVLTDLQHARTAHATRQMQQASQAVHA